MAVTAMCLSTEHLRREVDKIDWLRRAIRGTLIGYRGHPTVQEWSDHLDALVVARDCMVRQIVWRGRPTKHDLVWDVTPSLPGYSRPDYGFRYYAENRVALLVSDPEWYEQWAWTDEPGRV